MTIVLNDVVSNNNTSVINTNFTKIEDAINNDLLKREIEIGEANEMRTHLDMNSNRVTNVADGVNPQDAATVAQLDEATPVKGVDYFDGEDGADGATGPKGDTGDTGATGVAGADGEDGEGQVITIVAGTNITVDATDPANPIVSAAGSVGESNTSSNSGAGEGLAKAKAGVDLPFKSLVEGTNITLTSDADTITIDAAGGGASNELYYTVIATAVTTLDITLSESALDIDVFITIDNDSGAESEYSLFHNNEAGTIDATDANYFRTEHQTNNGTDSGTEAANASIGKCSAAQMAQVTADLHCHTRGSISQYVLGRELGTDSGQQISGTMVWNTEALTGLTKLRIVATQTNGIGVGTRVIVRKLH